MLLGSWLELSVAQSTGRMCDLVCLVAPNPVTKPVTPSFSYLEMLSVLMSSFIENKRLSQLRCRQQPNAS